LGLRDLSTWAGFFLFFLLRFRAYKGFCVPNRGSLFFRLKSACSQWSCDAQLNYFVWCDSETLMPMLLLLCKAPVINIRRLSWLDVNLTLKLWFRGGRTRCIHSFDRLHASLDKGVLSTSSNSWRRADDWLRERKCSEMRTQVWRERVCACISFLFFRFRRQAAMARRRGRAHVHATAYILPCLPPPP
jgi:hypothetical protein